MTILEFHDMIFGIHDRYKFDSGFGFVNDPEYKKIMEMDPKISIPYLMETLTTKPTWVNLLLLTEITKVKPLEQHAGRFYHKIVDWINWYDSVGREQYKEKQ